MSLRQQGWGSLAFVPPIPTPNISKKRIWKIPQIQEPEDYFEDAKDDQDEEEDQFEDAQEDDQDDDQDEESRFIEEEDQPVFYTTERSFTEFEDTEESADNEPVFYTTESLQEFNGTNSDTLSWLYIINSMGFDRETHTFDSSKRFVEWGIETINYQKNIIDNCLYTSRVHDLLDLLREGNQLAEILLKRLADRETDEYERRFLLGKEKYLSFTNESLRDYLKRWISGNIEDSNQIKYLDVRKVTDMKELFLFYTLKIPPDKYVLDLTYWDVSNVTDMYWMFETFNVTGIKNWNTKNVKNMGFMFHNTTTFNENIGSWDTSNVTNMSYMFQGAKSFNQNIGTWDTSKVTNMSHMFEGAISFNQDIRTWETGKVENMSHMFEGATSFNQNIGEWETGNVGDMSHMFQEAISFNQDIRTWETGNVGDMSHMFEGATSFNQNIGKWDTGHVFLMINMFYNATSFNQNIREWETGKVRNMSRMFQGATSFNNEIGKWKTGNVFNMSFMFQGAKSFNQNIGEWDTSKVTNMSHMFEGAISFNQNIGTWKTGKVENMSHMFEGATSFNQNIGEWDTGNVGDMTDMFKGATSFNKEIRKRDIINVPYEEVPSRISSEVHMMIPSIESTTTFRGTPLSEMIAMMYLLHNYPQYCVVIPPSSYVLNGLNFDVTFNLISLEWNQQTKDIDIPDGFWDSVKECLQKKPNFIIMPFGLPRHANYLIYDSNTKELERFDPNGFTFGEQYNPPNLEKKLKDLFNSNVQEGMIEKVYAPMSFCPRRSFQALQELEYEKKPGDPGGFCSAWSAWYADTRLANPNKTRKQVVDMALKKFEDEPGTMTQYIRSYSVFITKAEELLRKSNNPASVFRLLIEKSKYT